MAVLDRQPSLAVDFVLQSRGVLDQWSCGALKLSRSASSMLIPVEIHVLLTCSSFTSIDYAYATAVAMFPICSKMTWALQLLGDAHLEAQFELL